MTRFDLEQQIMSCWIIIDDINLLNSKLQEDEPGSLIPEEVANYLLGLETIYSIKFDELFRAFEKSLKENKV